MSAELTIAGDPFAHVVPLRETSDIGGGVPAEDWVAPLWVFYDEGDFNHFGRLAFSLESGGRVQDASDLPGPASIAGISVSFSVSADEVQKLTGRMGRSCQYRELEMPPAPPPT